MVEWNGQKYPSLKRAEDAADMILHFAPETNGELAYRAYQFVEKSVGLPACGSGREESRCATQLQRPASTATPFAQ